MPFTQRLISCVESSSGMKTQEYSDKIFAHDL